MTRSLKLRQKILFALFGLAVIPMAVTLGIVSFLNQRQLQHEIQAQAQRVIGFIQQNTESSKKEKAEYLQLIARNPMLVRGILAAKSGNSFDHQLLESLQQAQRAFNFDRLEVLDPAGKLLIGSLGPYSETVSPTATPLIDSASPIIAASLKGKTSSAILPVQGKLAIVTSAPIRSDDTRLGVAVGITFFDDDYIGRISGLSGAELAFYDESGVFSATSKDFEQVDLANALKGQQSLVQLGGTPYALFVTHLAGPDRGVLVAIDISKFLAARSELRTILLLILLGTGLLAILSGQAIANGILRPLGTVVDTFKEIAEGEADLSRQLTVRSRDEVGELAGSFNLFVRRLAEMVRRARGVASDITEATNELQNSSREINLEAVRQAQSLDESFHALQSIEESIGGIAESTSNLVESVEGSSSATLELGATIEEIASHMESLFGTIDEVSTSINEMSVSSQQIAENIEILSSSTEVTASSITELDASIKEIEENAEMTNRLTEEAAEDAQKGKAAVDETIQGIVAIRETVDRASGAILDLGKQSTDIGRILTVIDDVADQTGLLALNAAIIAAQAGEHGKGFAVVADEIRELAERTAVSTREIADIIANLRHGTEEAVKAMNAGSERVYQEAGRSKATGEALDKIRSSTLKAMEQVRSIVRATQEQSRGSQQITNSMNQVASMLGQIATAIKQQTAGIRQLARATESLKEIASMSKQSTGEQAKGSRQIAANMEQIRTMIERIDEATREQIQRNRQVVEAVSSIREIAEGNASRTAAMDRVVEILSQQTAALEDEVGAFKA
jgi:methyl-accepting chemotaxis protein